MKYVLIPLLTAGISLSGCEQTSLPPPQENQHQPANFNQAQQYMLSFPKTLHAAKEIMISTNTSTADVVLVHLRDPHYDARMNEALQKIATKNMVDIITLLSERNAQFFKEGMYPAQLALHADLREAYDSINQGNSPSSSWFADYARRHLENQKVNYELEKKPTDDLEEKLSYPEYKKAELGRRIVDKHFFIPPHYDPCLHLYLDDQIELAPLEKQETYIARKGENLEEFEDTTLAYLFDEQKAAVAQVICGAAHDWSNNIAEWNATHPEKQIGHIRVTPKGIDAIYQAYQARQQVTEK